MAETGSEIPGTNRKDNLLTGSQPLSSGPFRMSMDVPQRRAQETLYSLSELDDAEFAAFLEAFSPQIDATKLKAFAVKCGIPTEVAGWENAAILQAAAEHPALSETRRRRGRPKAESILPSIENEDKVLIVINRIRNLSQTEMGRRCSSAKAARLMAIRLDGDNPRYAADIEGRAKYYENLASKARRRQRTART